MAVSEIQVAETSPREVTEDLLADLGVVGSPRWPWVHVGASTRREGWKIHLSCTPSSLKTLISHVVAEHSRTRFVFKAIGTTSLAETLNEGAFGASQVGKCVTVYPEDDRQFAHLVDAFGRITGIDGPCIPDDVRLGHVVYARYGGFNPDMTRDLLGQSHRMIADPSGQLVRDDYDRAVNSSRFNAAFGHGPLAKRVYPAPTPPKGLLNNRYMVIDVLKETPKGYLIQAIDTSSKGTVRAVIVKHGRAHVLSDHKSADIRTRLRRQERWHALAAPLDIAPACDPYFEIDGDGYLPVVFQAGDNFEAWIQTFLRNTTIENIELGEKVLILNTLIQTGRKISALHDLGLVHRDLSPSNILLDFNGRAYLSDLEIAAQIGETSLFGKGTPGFMAPEQEQGAAADPRADIRGYAAIILYALTGLDPRRLPASRSGDLNELRALGPSFDTSLWKALSAGLAPRPGDRPTMAELALSLTNEVKRLSGKTELPAVAFSNLGDRNPPSGRPDAERIPPQDNRTANTCHDSLAIRSTTFGNAGLATLSSPALRAGPQENWFSAPIGNDTTSGTSPEIRRSLNRGRAGVLYLCARAAAHLTDKPDVRDLVSGAAQWLITDRDAADYGMPGLHFGEAGVLVALYAAQHAGLISFKTADVDHLWRAAFDPAPRWPDVTHGAAGLLLALEHLRATVPPTDTPDMDWGTVHHQLLDYLVTTQNPDGSWTLPEGVDGLSGETVSGFAHGVAGMAYALTVCGSKEHGRAAVRSGEWLLKMAKRDGQGALLWAYSDKNPDRWNWWCHGGTGIATLFTALFERDGDEKWRDAAIDCFRVVPEGFNPPNLSLCHGAAGMGELLLDADRQLGVPALRAKAEELAEHIIARTGTGKRDVFWIIENTDIVSADLMVGMGGVIDFLLRIADPEDELRFPTHSNRSVKRAATRLQPTWPVA